MPHRHSRCRARCCLYARTPLLPCHPQLPPLPPSRHPAAASRPPDASLLRRADPHLPDALPVCCVQLKGFERTYWRSQHSRTKQERGFNASTGASETTTKRGEPSWRWWRQRAQRAACHWQLHHPPAPAAPPTRKPDHAASLTTATITLSLGCSTLPRQPHRPAHIFPPASPLTPARRIPAGQHVFPFLFTLPASLPTSFCYQSGGSLKCVSVLGLCVFESSGLTSQSMCSVQLCPAPCSPPSRPPTHSSPVFSATAGRRSFIKSRLCAGWREC